VYSDATCESEPIGQIKQPIQKAVRLIFQPPLFRFLGVMARMHRNAVRQNVRLWTFLFGAILFLISSRYAGAQNPPSTPPPSGTQSAADPISGPIRKADTIRVVVAGAEWLSGEFRVENDGSISIPRVGPVIVVEKMQGDAAQAIGKQIETKKLLKKADVSVYIVSRKPREVLINGAVQMQGKQTLKDNAVLSEALETAAPLGTADLSRVVINRAGKEITVNYKKYRNGESKDEAFNPKLEDDDRIFIFALTPTEGAVKVNGEVKDSTKVIFPLTQGLTVGQILQMVGGITDYADRNGIVLIRGEQRIKVPYDDIVRKVPGKDIAMMDKDELNVPRLERPKQFKVAGGVRNANTFLLTTKTTLLDAIGQAGGLIEGVPQNKIAIRRTNAFGVVTTLKYDLRKNTDAAAEVLDGDFVDVPYPPRQRNLLNDIGTIIGVLSGALIIYSQVR
jgi:protein involved in polysaccharide export with SLBB domain